jgi:hypothetical protein
VPKPETHLIHSSVSKRITFATAYIPNTTEEKKAKEKQEKYTHRNRPKGEKKTYFPEPVVQDALVPFTPAAIPT